MTKKEFQTFLNGKITYLDGATGSNLMKRGMPSGVCPEKWVLEHRDVCLGLQKEYVEAGTEILYCPTFGANRVKLSEYKLYDQMKEMIHGLVSISKEAAASADHPVYVAGDLTMTGKQLEPIGTMKFDQLVDIYKEQIQYLDESGVDLLVIETMMSLQETRAALIAAKESCALPVMVTLSYEKGGRTLFGADVLAASKCLEKLGADAVGINCSLGPIQMRDMIRTIAKHISIPVIAKPNAGMPAVDEKGQTYYDLDAEAFAEGMISLVKEGACLLGGCCGTSPEYIALLKEKTKDLTPAKWNQKEQWYLTSERKTVSFDLSSSFVVIGEKINPTGKPEMQEELEDEFFDTVTDFASEQEEAGAVILDVNMGLGSIDEEQMLKQALLEIQSVCNLPLSLDSDNPKVLETALRNYPGRALLNSVPYNPAKCDKLFEMASKYGAMCVLMPLTEKGVPETVEERISVINALLKRAMSFGLTKQDLLVDALVTGIIVNPEAASQALEIIRYCKEKGIATICGISNISFGLPKREQVNAAFLNQAVCAGLNCGILNPCQEEVMKILITSQMLAGKEDGVSDYLESV